MTRAVLDVRPLDASEWRVLRHTRLRALRDAPHAFSATYDHELSMSEDDWRRRLDTGTWVVAATERGAVIGIAGLVDGQQGEPEHVESIWVATAHRHRGVFSSLLDGLVDTARRSGLTHLLLWVFEDNVVARAAYECSGFEWTGERKLIDPVRQRYERRMRLTLCGP
jgi:RimJ/RimL family protein N-acetyltransferase